MDGLTDTLVDMALTIISLFPQSPIRPYIYAFNNSVVHQYLCYVNYIIPVSEMIGILSLWIVGVSVYYIYQIILRWIKVIE